MRVLLDNCVDVRFGGLIKGHEVTHARDLGWQDLSNGKLMTVAENAGFEVLVTVDKNIRHQQNMRKRQICLVTLGSVLTDFTSISLLSTALLSVLSSGIAPGTEVVIS